MTECRHDVLEKYVTNHGLVCRDCLTAADFARYPGWHERLARRDRRQEQAKHNFNGRQQSAFGFEGKEHNA